MKKILSIALIFIMVLALPACGAQTAVPVQPVEPSAPTPNVPAASEKPVEDTGIAEAEPVVYSRKNGEFRDMTVDQLLSELGPGYSDGGYLCEFDPLKAYDPYLSVPIWFNLGLETNNGSSDNYRMQITLGQSVSLSCRLGDLQNPPSGGNYIRYTTAAGTKVRRDLPLKIKVENARIELPGESIPLSEANGTFETTAYSGKESWVWGGLCNADTILPDVNTLRLGAFKADVTLLEAPKSPGKAEYYVQLNDSLPPPTSEWFIFLKDEGFHSIRFQVTWFNHTNDDTYKIDEEWLKKVEEMVNLALEQGLYCSINLNWDMYDSYDPTFTAGLTKEQIAASPRQSGWLTLDGDLKVEERFATVWTQIAEYFKDYDEHLIFESVNEPNAPDDAVEKFGAVGDPQGHGWKSIGKISDNINRLNQIFVDSVRGTGGNNAQRFLFVPPFFHKGVERYLKNFKLPDDPANHTIVCINYYLGDEAVGGGDPFPAVEKYLTSKGIGVVITEFGSDTNDEPDRYQSRLKFMEETVSNANRLNIPIIYYGGGWGTSENLGDQIFCLYNPYTFEPAFPELIGILMSNRW